MKSSTNLHHNNSEMDTDTLIPTNNNTNQPVATAGSTSVDDDLLKYDSSQRRTSLVLKHIAFHSMSRLVRFAGKYVCLLFVS